MSIRDSLVSLLGQAGPLFEAPDTVEIIINPDGRVWLDSLTQTSVDTGLFVPADARDALIRLLASHMKVTISADRPSVAAIVPGTLERIQAQIPPMVSAPALAIRMPARSVIPLDQHVTRGTLTQDQLTIIRAALANRKNIAVTGATGSGKTTLANSMLNDPLVLGDRHVIIQDLPELRTSAPNTLNLLTRSANPVITAQHLLQIALRNRPDRIHVGDCRDGASMLELFKGWNAGHPGGITTFHADSPEDALYRIEDLFAEVTQQMPYRQISRTLGLIVHMERTAAGRRVTEMITNIRHDRDDGYTFERAGQTLGNA